MLPWQAKVFSHGPHQFHSSSPSRSNRLYQHLSLPLANLGPGGVLLPDQGQLIRLAAWSLVWSQNLSLTFSSYIHYLQRFPLVSFCQPRNILNFSCSSFNNSGSHLQSIHHMPYTFYPSSYLVLTTALQGNYYLYLTELETGTENSSCCLISFFCSIGKLLKRPSPFLLFKSGFCSTFLWCLGCYQPPNS